MADLSRRQTLLAALAPAFAFGGAARVCDRGKRRLNIVLVLMDDLGWRDVGCYGSEYHLTPNIDALCRDGVRFTDAYAACPVCSPTRASILTGRYPARIGLTDYIGGARRGKMLPAEYVHHLPADLVTIAQCLKPAGYACASIGKWHLGPEPYYPEHFGFDVNVAGCALGHPPSYFWPYGNEQARVPLKDGREGEYLTDRLTDEAIGFIREQRGRPFFLYLSHYAVHNPQQAPERWTTRFADREVSNTRPELFDWHGRRVRGRQSQPVYAGMIASADDGIGRLMEELRRLDVYDETLIVFTSDNGGLSTAEGTPTSNLPLAGGKGWVYEGGIRVPLIVRWPGTGRRGVDCSVPVMSTDLFPTFLRAAGLPLRPDAHMDGRDLRPLLSGSRGSLSRPLFWHYPHYSNQGSPPSGAIRVGSLKLIENYEDGSVELYDLSQDLGEQRDLSQARRDDARRMQARLARWRREVGGRMPVPDSDGAGGTSTSPAGAP